MASVFLYVPNIIGYIRFLSIVICWVYFTDYKIVVPVYAIQAALDGVDGTVARCLNQCSLYGAWLDVLVDNFGRTILLSGTYSWGIFIACFEWTVFVCSHTIGKQWREAIEQAPWWVHRVMEKGFHTPIGGYTICGLHGLPLLLYMYKNAGIVAFLGNYHRLLLIPIILLVPARVLCGIVESWFIYIHVKKMDQQLENPNKNNDTDEQTSRDLLSS